MGCGEVDRQTDCHVTEARSSFRTKKHGLSGQLFFPISQGTVTVYRPSPAIFVSTLRTDERL